MRPTLLTSHTERSRPEGTARKDGARSALAFTLVELLVVIAIVGLLSALVLGVGNAAIKQMKRSKVKAQLNELVTAIESYKQKFGNYPPDNTNNYARNSLYYELMGAIYNPGAQTFSTVDGSSTMGTVAVQTTFGRDGFLHAFENPKDIKPLFELKSTDQKKKIWEVANNCVYVLAVTVPGNPTNELTGAGNIKINPWRYDASSTNRHNPGSYDLWAEVQIGDTTEIIGNWKSSQ